MIEYYGYELLKPYLIEGKVMIELGNQIMNLEDNQGESAKDFFTRKYGIVHTSIDQNGKDGALAHDLSKPVDIGFKADIVTDFGTSEHVTDLYQCLCNVFNFCKAEGNIIHKNPKTGNFPNHGFHYFTVEFWQQYAELTGLKIVGLEEHPIYHNTKDGWEIICVLRKTKRSKISTEEEFKKLPIYEL